MRLARQCLALLLAGGLCDVSGFAAAGKPLGVVLQVQFAHVDRAEVATGATVYSGDTYETEPGGSLQLSIAPGQVYLQGASAAEVLQDGGNVRVVLSRGTAGFSSPAAGGVYLETPAGSLRGAPGKPAYGQATILQPNELLVTSYKGELILDNDGEVHSIPEGKTFRVVIEADQDPGSQQQGQVQAPVQNRKRRRRLAFFLILGGAVALATIPIWHTLEESPTKP